jgi:Flp pilus assembly protein TadB
VSLQIAFSSARLVTGPFLSPLSFALSCQKTFKQKRKRKEKKRREEKRREEKRREKEKEKEKRKKKGKEKVKEKEKEKERGRERGRKRKRKKKKKERKKKTLPLLFTVAQNGCYVLFGLIWFGFVILSSMSQDLSFFFLGCLKFLPKDRFSLG